MTLEPAPQYASAHVYAPPGQLGPFVDSWIATFGGALGAKARLQITPTPSLADTQMVLSPVGTLSVFEFVGPRPFPFGLERVGWRTDDIEAEIARAREHGAAVLVDCFGDETGRHAIIQFPGGFVAQLYQLMARIPFHPLRAAPESRVYVSPDSVEAFLSVYLPFTGSEVLQDEARADGALIGRPGSVFRRVRLDSPLGPTAVLATDGHLPYPHGYEQVGYCVEDIDSTLALARAAGADVLVPPQAGPARGAVLRLPGGHIVEAHPPEAGLPHA